MIRKLLFLLLVVLVLGASVVAAQDATQQASSAAKVTLTYLVEKTEHQETTQALVDAYMKLHPNVTIYIENLSGRHRW